MSNTSVGGFDRVLEMKLLYKGVHFHYLPDTCVKDEKYRKRKISISNAAAGCPPSITASLSLPVTCCPLFVTGTGTFAINFTSKSLFPGVAVGVCVHNGSLHIYCVSNVVSQVVGFVWNFTTCLDSSHSSSLLDTAYI